MITFSIIEPINGPLIALAFVFALLLTGQVLITLVFGRNQSSASTATPGRTIPGRTKPGTPTNDAQPIVITLDPIDEYENPS